MTAFDFTDPTTDAYTYTEAVADEIGEEQVHPYFVALTDELFQLVPGLREHFADTVLAELCEDVARREDPKHAHATVELVTQIQTDWRNQS